MVDEFEFFRKVQTYYQHVQFQVDFTYKLLHKKEKSVQACGNFRCRVDPHSQLLEYIINLKSELIARPFSEKVSFLFSSQYNEIPSQELVIEQLSIYHLRYPVPIHYDWKAFVVKGASEAINTQSLQQVLDKYRFKGVNGEEVDAKLKVASVKLDWYNEFR